MQIAQVVLDYIKTLIWPAMALVVVLVFRRPIRSLIGEGRTRVKGPGFEIKTEAATFALNSQIAASAQRLTRPSAQQRPARGEERRAAADTPAGEVDATEEAARRQAVEQLLKEAAAWGWQMARLGWSQPPVPHVTWQEDGRVQLSSPGAPAH